MTAVLSALLHEKRHRPAWRGLLLALVAVTAWFAFAPADPAPQMEGADKIDHLLAFGAQGCAAALSLRRGWRAACVAALGLLTWGGVIEAVQTLLPTRYGDWADLAADAVGIAAGLLLAATLRRLFPPARP